MGALLTFPLELLCFAIPHRGRGLRFTQYRFAAAKLQDSIPHPAFYGDDAAGTKRSWVPGK